MRMRGVAAALLTACALTAHAEPVAIAAAADAIKVQRIASDQLTVAGSR